MPEDLRCGKLQSMTTGEFEKAAHLIQFVSNFLIYACLWNADGRYHSSTGSAVYPPQRCFND